MQRQVPEEWLDELENFLEMLKNKNLNIAETLRSIERDFQEMFKKSSENGYQVNSSFYLCVLIFEHYLLDTLEDM